MKTIQDYQSLLTSEHQGKPKLAAMLVATVSPMVQVQALMSAMGSTLYDLDSNPQGEQLDTIGQWVGAARKVTTPITGVFFSFDDTAAIGWDFGIWKDPINSTTVLTNLPDDVYLTLIRAKIASNQWDGTTEGAYRIWESVFPALRILIQDNQSMSFSVAVQGAVLDALTLALLTGGYLPLKPEGVAIDSYIVPVDTNALFAFDIETAFLNGFDVGSWGVEVMPT